MRPKRFEYLSSDDLLQVEIELDFLFYSGISDFTKFWFGLINESFEPV